jgi:hypothetical protein
LGKLIDKLQLVVGLEDVLFFHIPVVPQKAVAEVSKIGNYRRG